MNEKKHILVVDDDQRIRKLLQKYLRKNNFLVSTASNASEASRYTNLIDFDLFILDVMMPGDDGLSLTKKILSRFYTPIILLTAISTFLPLIVYGISFVSKVILGTCLGEQLVLIEVLILLIRS